MSMLVSSIGISKGVEDYTFMYGPKVWISSLDILVLYASISRLTGILRSSMSVWRAMVEPASLISAHVCHCPHLKVQLSLLGTQVKAVGVSLVQVMYGWVRYG